MTASTTAASHASYLFPNVRCEVFEAMHAAHVGGRLGRYQLLAEIGQGGMSVVFRARDTQLQRDVAVKVMHPFLAEQAEARARFAREAVAVARLHHPHIIEIFDYSDANHDATYIVTELIEGMSLAKRLEDTPLALPEAALVIARAIADALQAAHAASVIHRDLKPENIMLGPAGELKLTDFGIARILDNQSMTVTGTLLGSPAYMAPEYIEGQATDARSDIFSLGVVLYQMAVGTLPFVAPTPHALLKRIATGTYTPPEQANPQIHAALGRIIKRCLAVRMDERYSSSKALVAAIDAFLQTLSLDPDEERPRIFADPAAYAAIMTPLLLQRYLKLGLTAWRDGHTGEALEHFDRVLSIEPQHPEVKRLLRRISTASWARRALLGTAVVGCVAGGAGLMLYATPSASLQPAPAPAPRPMPSETPPVQAEIAVTVTVLGRGSVFIDETSSVPNATGAVRVNLLEGSHRVRVVGKDRTDSRDFVVRPNTPLNLTLDVRPRPTPAVAPSASPGASTDLPLTRDVEFKPAGQWVTLYVDDDPTPVVKEAMRPFTVPLRYGRHRVRLTNDKAQPWEQDVVVGPHDPARAIIVRLHPLDARLRVEGAPDGSVIEVADRMFVVNPHTRNDPIFVPLPEGQGAKEYEVVVRAADGSQVFVRRRELFRPGEERTLAISPNPL